MCCGRCLLPAHTWPEDRPSRFLELKQGGEGVEGEQEEQDIFKDEVESTGDEVVCVDEAEVKCMQEDEVGAGVTKFSQDRSPVRKGIIEILETSDWL